MTREDTLAKKRLVVSTARETDSGRNIARLHPDTMEQLFLESGDVVQLRGAETTASTVREMDGPDASREAVGIDRVTRENAEVDVGDHVVVQPVEATPAERVSFELAEGITSHATGGELETALQERVVDRAITRGDIVPIMANEGELLGKAEQSVRLLVTDIHPDEGVRIRDDTTLEVPWS